MTERQPGSMATPRGAVDLCSWLAAEDDGAPRMAWFGRHVAVEVGYTALRRYPDDLGVRIAAARLLLTAGDVPGALEVLVRAASERAGEPLLLRLLGEALFRSGDAVRARRMLERAVAGGLTDPETLAWRSRARLCARIQEGCDWAETTRGVGCPHRDRVEGA